MRTSNVLAAALGEVLAASGFRCRSSRWFREVPIGLIVLDLQKSRWGPQYYINLGVYVRALGDLSSPPVHKCHFYTRATSRDRNTEKHWESVMDLEAPIPDDVRASELRALVLGRVLPFTDELATLEGLRAAYSRGELNDGLLLVTLRRHLEAH